MDRHRDADRGPGTSAASGSTEKASLGREGVRYAIEEMTERKLRMMDRSP